MGYSEDWFTKNIPIWERVLADLKGKPIHAIELGSYEGRATVWLLENILTHPAATLDCVDTWEGGVEHGAVDMAEVERRFNENIEPHQIKVDVHKMTSADFLKNSHRLVNLVYIDASHFAADVLTDAVLSHLVLKPGGIIIFDDYLWGALNHAPNVPKGAIDAFMECYAEQYEALSLGYQVILRKKQTDDGQSKTPAE